MKFSKYILKLSLLFAAAACFGGCLKIVPVDVVTDGQDLYFILEKPAQIDYVQVHAFKPGEDVKPAWQLTYDMTVPLKERKHVKLSQIRYGRKYEVFPLVMGPFPLKKNVEYQVEINMPGKFAKEIFVVNDDNTVVMPRPTFERQKTRSYEITTDKNGEKVFRKK